MYNNNNLEIGKFLFFTLTATTEGKKSGAANPSGWIYRENQEKYLREKIGRCSKTTDRSPGKRGKNRRSFGILLKSGWTERN